MKKIICILLSLCFIISLCSCGTDYSEIKHLSTIKETLGYEFQALFNLINSADTSNNMNQEAISNHINYIYSIYSDTNNFEIDRKAAFLIFSYYNADYILISEGHSHALRGQKIRIKFDTVQNEIRHYLKFNEFLDLDYSYEIAKELETNARDYIQGDAYIFGN